MTNPGSEPVAQDGPILCVDVGSTFTKGLLVAADGSVCRAAATPTTLATDVLDGIDTVRALTGAPRETPVVACSSAGGGLRLAVVGYEASVTALAGHRVGLSAGARIVHVFAGRLDRASMADLRASRPDLVLLVGGTDGGNADVLLHNATRLGSARFTAPVVLAGNADVADRARAALERTGRTVVVADNVLPRIGVIAPQSARTAIRAAFLRHVIGGKHLSRSADFVRLVRCATPDAVLRGVEVLAGAGVGDALTIDIGGATTDVYSAVTPMGEDAGVRREISPQLRFARTVEADLGMRWSAPGVVEAADREHLTLGSTTRACAEAVLHDVAHLPGSPGEWESELALATVAAVVAARRHGRAAGPGEAPRALRDVGILIGSGGVLRHAPTGSAERVLGAVLADHGGGWLVPRAARGRVDSAYVLFAVGLLADDHPRRADALARSLLDPR
ncbi:MAG: glutamate mutase L [Tetrasphaera sp.]|nr:glutamate mutase L [Tetrasphaera sp.]